MGVLKKYTRGSQSVQVRRARLRMTAHTADPIIKIINRDEKDIGLARTPISDSKPDIKNSSK